MSICFSGSPFHVGDKFDVMPINYDCTLDTDPLINPYFIIDKFEITECFKAIARVESKYLCVKSPC